MQQKERCQAERFDAYDQSTNIFFFHKSHLASQSLRESGLWFPRTLALEMAREMRASQSLRESGLWFHARASALEPRRRAVAIPS